MVNIKRKWLTPEGDMQIKDLWVNSKGVLGVEALGEDSMVTVSTRRGPETFISGIPTAELLTLLQ